MNGSEARAEGGLSFTVTDTGVLVRGAAEDVRTYVGNLRSVPDLTDGLRVAKLADTAAAATALTSLATTHGEYVQLSQRSLDLLRAHGALPGQTPGSYWGFVRDANGFAGNLEFTEVSLTAGQAAALQLAAATVALKIAIANVQRTVERVEGKVDGLVAIANAKVIGDVIAHHALLSELTDTLDRTGRLPKTDWQTVASLGVSVPAAIEQLRQTALLRVGELDGRADAAERARTLRDVVDAGELRRALRLLVVAEDSYYRWQRIRLEHARTADPDQVADMAERANAQLAADMRADRELIDLLDTKLVEYAIQRPLERLHPFVTKKLADHAESLHDDLVAFAKARRIQTHAWEPLTRPTWSDAANEARDRAIGTGQQVGEAALHVGRAIEASTTDVAQTVGSWTSMRATGITDKVRHLFRG